VSIRREIGDPRRPIPPPTGEKVFYSASTMEVFGTESEIKEALNMARLVGTGKDPEGRYGEGVVFDVPAYESTYDDLIEKGWAEALPAVDDPGRSKTQIANAMVRGDLLSHPADAAMAAEIDDADALAITHTGDPDASAGDLPEAGTSPGPVTVGEMAIDDPGVVAAARELEKAPEPKTGKQQSASRRAREDKSTESPETKS
jgi:hypothetical protein